MEGRLKLLLVNQSTDVLAKFKANISINTDIANG